MIRYIALILLACGCATASAHAQRVDSAEILNYGIFETSKRKEITDSSISTGQRVNYENSKITKRTAVVSLDFPPNDLLVFGATFRLRGSPAGSHTTVRVVWLYPKPGLMYQPGKPKLRDEYDDDIILGGTKSLFWTIGAPASRVPGTWTLQVWQGDRLLVEKSFDLVGS